MDGLPPVFFPLSDYRFNGVNWWRTPWLARWPALVLASLCVCLLAGRYIQARRRRVQRDITGVSW